MLETHHFGADARLSGRMICRYDQQGRISAEESVSADGVTTVLAAYAYDEHGQKVKTQTLDYPSEDNVMIGIEGTNTSIAAREVKRVVTRYDECDEAVEVAIYNAEDALVGRVQIVRDGRGNVLEEVQLVGDVAPFGPCQGSLCPPEERGAVGEQQPQLSEEQRAEFEEEIARRFAPGAAMSKRMNTYDDEGRMVESKLTMIGMMADHRTMAYNGAGDKVEESSFGEDGKLQSKAIFRREYDDRGNWTEEVVSTASSWDAEFHLSTPQHVTRRKITYY